MFLIKLFSQSKYHPEPLVSFTCQSGHLTHKLMFRTPWSPWTLPPCGYAQAQTPVSPRGQVTCYPQQLSGGPAVSPITTVQQARTS